MKALVFVLAIVAVALIYRAAAAEPVQLEHDGKMGLWFKMSSARKLLKDVSKLPKVEQTLQLTEHRLRLEEKSSELLAKQLTDTEQVGTIWENAAREQAKMLASKQPWWRSPHLWVTIGLVVGVGATVGIAVAVRRTGAVP